MERNAPEFGRFTEPSLLILVSLSDGPKHGYAIMQDVEAGTGRPMGAGTLYAALARLEERGVRRAPGAGRPAPAVPPDRGRRVDARRAAPRPVRVRPARPRDSSARPSHETILIRCYPARWRARYGDEFQALLEERPLGPYDVADILLGALDARLRSRRAAGSPEGVPMSLRLGGIAAILGALILTVSWFGTFFGALPFDGRVLVALILVGSSLLCSPHDPERVPGPSDARTRLDRLHAFRHRRDRLHGRHARPDRRRGR